VLKIKVFGSNPKKKFESLSIGCFDGLHLGHKQVLSSLTPPALVLKPLPSPKLVFGRVSTRKNLYSLKLFFETLKDLHSEIYLGILLFNERTRSLTASKFLAELTAIVKFKNLVLGEDAVIGNDQLSVQKLAYQTENLNLKLQIVRLQKINGKKVSSSWLRSAILSGNLELYRELTNTFPILDIRQTTYGITCRNLHPNSGLFEALHNDRAYRIGFNEKKITIAPSAPPKQGFFQLIKKIK
jgi:FAD synthase